MVIFYKKWKKYNEIHLTKNKMDLNIRPFFLGAVFFRTNLPCSGGHHLERGGMPLHDAVGINYEKGATTENPICPSIRANGCLLMMVCVLYALIWPPHWWREKVMEYYYYYKSNKWIYFISPARAYIWKNVKQFYFHKTCYRIYITYIGM